MNDENIPPLRKSSVMPRTRRNRQSAYHQTLNFFLELSKDIVFLGIIIGFSSFLVSFYFDAVYINTGYPDWLVHAFRIKMLSLFGYTSWTHVWSNGINLWQSYQFFPQYATLFLSNLLHVNITRAMVLMTIGIFILLRVEIYILLRLEKFSPLVSCIASMLSFPIELYWFGVSDYSLQFAFLLFPFYIYLWKYYLQDNISITYPFLVGISFYIHPVLTFYAGMLWLVGLLFSEKKIFSVRSFLSISVFLIGSSFFWFPLVFKDSYTYTNPYLQSLDYFKLTVHNLSWIGLSVSLAVALLCIGVRTFIPIKTEWKWLKMLGVANFIFVIFVIIGITVPLPYVIAAFQFTRGVPLIGIAICIAAAPFIQDILSSKFAIGKFILLFGVAYVFIEGIWITSYYSPFPIKTVQDPINQYIQAKNLDVKEKRVWSSDIETTSFFAPPTIRLPYSYMSHLDSNQISPRLNQIILYANYDGEAPLASMQRIDDYFKISGVQYAFFDELSPFTRSLKDPALPEHYKDLGRIKLKYKLTHVFQVPWTPRDAVLMSNKYANELNHFPFSLKFEDNNDYISLDQYVHNFSGIIYASDNKPLSITYPTQESVSVSIPSNRSSNIVYIDESYSNAWHATFNGEPQKISPVGPNYMKVTLSNTTKGGTLYLKHTWPEAIVYIIIGIVVTPFTIGLYNIISFLIKKHGKS